MTLKVPSNFPIIQVNEIIHNFFEPGHTFMAADSFHAAVEKSMRSTSPVTFAEFINVETTKANQC